MVDDISSFKVKLNIGGTKFQTSSSHFISDVPGLEVKHNYLEKRIRDIKSEEDEEIFVDRDPKYFKHILNFIRKNDRKSDAETFELPNDRDELRGIIKDADFYELDTLRVLALKKLHTCWFPESFLKYKQKIDLMKLCNLNQVLNWRLIYKASVDGFASTDFHAKCDGFEGTLVVVKTTDAFIFGGYTEAAWSQSGGYKKDRKAFIFSLENNDEPLVIPCVKSQCAIYCHVAYGPTFGDGHDLFIENESNIHGNSFSNLGASYPHPLYALDSPDAKSFLAGSVDFKTSDIEVYTKQ